jgi:hypothetical protein
MYRRPCWTRSSIGPRNGASTANGAIVMSSASAIRPRAWSTDVLKKRVPASATATNASATPPAALSSIRLDSPVRLAPEAPLSRCTTRPAPPATAAPARPAACDADAIDRPARFARAFWPESSIAQVFCLCQVP